MTPERWQRIKDLLYQAQNLALEERPGFLARTCAADQSLRQQVETLLASSEEAQSSFLERCPWDEIGPGTKMANYEIQELLGSGGMGEVYLARDVRLRRDVAIKVLPPFLTTDKDRLRRFEQEAQAAAALNHPNILAIFQLTTYEGSPCLVTELLEGETLRRQVSHGPLSPSKTIDYGVQIAHGLAAAHDKGIVHRDLKPENLFITRDGHVKILDFGLAKLKQAVKPGKISSPGTGMLTEPGTIMGTVGYMSPEQVRGQEVDHRTDIFALGAILYEMLTGERAFHKATAADTMSSILKEEPRPASHITANIPPALHRTVHRCLEKAPEQRFQSAADLAFALEALSDSSITGPPVAAPVQVSNGRRRAVTGALIMAILIALFFQWHRWPAGPRVEEVKQLTNDGEPKEMGGNLLSDGLRLYFSEGQVTSLKVHQTSVSGGPAALVPMSFEYATIDDLAPDASALLLRSADGKAWIQPLPAGEPRSVNVEYGYARFLPDGRIFYGSGPSLYVANADGSGRKKLANLNGQVYGLAVSRDGKRARFTIASDELLYSIWEINVDGSGLHKVRIDGLPESMGQIVGGWTPDGKYFLFQTEHGGRWDLWGLPETVFFQRPAAPFSLTNGPLSYEFPIASPDGKLIFALGSKKRGELIRYDSKNHIFLPYFSGASAVESRVSSDNTWMVYVSYPDHTLWRVRSDGTQAAQLTFAPMMVFYPAISPDGSKIAFSGMTSSSGLGLYVMNMHGGPPERVFGFGHAPAWSPDGNSLAFATLVPGHHLGDETHWCELRILDLRTKAVTTIPTGGNWFGPWWPQPNKIVAAAAASGSGEPHMYDLKTRKWSSLGENLNVLNWAPTGDSKYLYLLTDDSQGSKVRRLRASDFKIQTIANLGGIRLVADDSLGPASSGGWIGVAADGAPTLTKDVGSDEIYGLNVKWP